MRERVAAELKYIKVSNCVCAVCGVWCVVCVFN
jgi:hypothetical protein